MVVAQTEDVIWGQRIEDLFRSFPALVAFLAGPDHVYQFVSERFLDLIGHREIIGKSVREALPELEGQGFAGEDYFALLDRIYATGQAFSGQELLARSRQPGGTWADCYFTVVIQPTMGATGSVDGLLLQGMDITPQVRARREAEQALVREQIAHAAADRAADRTARLQTVTAALSEALTPIEVMRVVVEQGSLVLQASAASVALLTEDSTEIEVVYSQGYGQDILQFYQRFPLDAGVPLALTIRKGEAVWIESSDAWAQQFPKLLPTHQDLGYNAAAALPLLVKGRPIGAVGFSFSGPRAFGDEDRALTSALVQQCAQALDRARLFEADHRQAALLDLAYDAILVRDLTTRRIQGWNQGAEQLYGWTADEARGQAPNELLGTQFPQPLPQIEAQIREMGRWEGELIRTARDGRRIVVASRWALDCSGEESPGVILDVSTDITEQKKAQDALAYLALHDTLTGLPNRALFHDRLRHAIQTQHRGGGSLALLAMDLVRFKEVNDTYGHYVGDLVLSRLSERLQQVLRASDTFARLGGDEFALILPRTDTAGAVQAAQKMAAALQTPFDLDGERIQIAASIGIALCPEHAQDESLLLRRADAAMYAAKRAGSICALYDHEQDAAHRNRRALVKELECAIDHNQFILHFQPAINVATGRLDRLEALVRWLHPERGLLLPDTFIGLAEETGLVEPLTLWVLRSALQACQQWQKHAGGAGIAVNVSGVSLQNAALGKTIAGMLNHSSVAPSRLTLEVTESAVMAEPEQAMLTLTLLHEMGIAIAIDDFGTGYSSLAYLKRLPVDGIKIDRSFIQGLSGNENDSAIVQSVIDLGHSLSRAVTAEGVEDEQSYRLLASMGCDFAQGSYIAPPLPIVGLDKWLLQHHVSIN